MTGAHTPWPPERVEILRAMWDKGFSGGEIAKVLGVTRNSVMGMLHRQGLQRSPVALRRIKLDPAERLERKRARDRRLRAKRQAEKNASGRPTMPAIVARPPPIVCEAVDPVTIMELETHHCRFMISSTLYCGAHRVAPTSWCPVHLDIVSPEPLPRAPRRTQFNYANPTRMVA